MKLSHRESKTQEVEVIDDIVCNQCGGSLKEVESAGLPHCEGLVEVEVEGGYYSKKLGDMTCYTFSLCENCLDTMFKGFKIPPKILDRLAGDMELVEQSESPEE